MSSIPLLAWTKIEEFLFELPQKAQNQRVLLSSLANNANAFTFLKDIGFLDENGKLTETGKSYYYQKFVINQEREALELLSASIKEIKSVQMICQVFWGRVDITKDNLRNLLLIENLIENRAESDIGSFLALLNKCKILNYDKRSGKIKILYNPKIESKVTRTVYISPQTPYTNIKNLRLILAASKKYIWWLDKHFSLKGLEPLSEAVDGNSVQEIRILTGISSNINERLKKDYERFQIEMGYRGIQTECRVIVDSTLYHQIHDRWLITEDATYNLPAINSIYQNQFSEINKTENIPPFGDWWKLGKELVLDWNEIVKASKTKDN